jgi:hypothetical protein
MRRMGASTEETGMRLVYLGILIALILAPSALAASSKDDDSVTYKDFTLTPGDRVDIGDYRLEMIEVQSLSDGIVVVKVSKIGGSLEEQRALLQNSPNNFDDGADEGGLTLTAVDIPDDRTAEIRVEYLDRLGTPRKRAADATSVALRDMPKLDVKQTFDKTQMRVGDSIKVTVEARNIGLGLAQDVTVVNQPPMPEFTYLAGYPPKLKSGLKPGDSDSAVFVLKAAQEGTVQVSGLVVSYADSRKKGYSNSSKPFQVTILPKSKPNLEMVIVSPAPMDSGGKGTMNVTLINRGDAPAMMVDVRLVDLPDGLEVSGIDRRFVKISPGGEESYTVPIVGKSSGNYTINLKASYQSDDDILNKEASAEIVVKEQEYKYLYFLFLTPALILGAWIYKRYKEYKY